MNILDIAISFDWEPDKEFVQDLNDFALKQGLKPYILYASNFYDTLNNVSVGKISFRFFLDRVAEDNHLFKGLPGFLKGRGVRFCNEPEMAKQSNNKFIMHLDFVKNSILCPKTVFLFPQDTEKAIEEKINNLPKPFVLKPQMGCSGDGVVLDVYTPDDVLKIMKMYPNISYIAQEKITPSELDREVAWFRVVYCLGEFFVFWWNPKTHIYLIVSTEQMHRFVLQDVVDITRQIFNVCGLNFFSTEIALYNGKFFVIDYINDQPDMRKKSKFVDGVPDEIVGRIVEKIISFVKQEGQEVKKS
jgi:hypothetical protein